MKDQIFSKWVRLGVNFPGHDMYKGSIDIERHIIETVTAGQDNPVLIDIMLGWLYAYGDLVNIHRISSMVSDDTSGFVGALIDFIVQNKGPRKLRKILDYCKPFPEGKFIFRDTQKYPHLAWESMEQAGDINNKWNVYWKSVEIKTDALFNAKYVLSKNPTLAMRTILGVTMRADIISILYHHGKATISEITNYLLFDFASVSRELHKMEEHLLVKKEKKGLNVFVKPTESSRKLLAVYS